MWRSVALVMLVACRVSTEEFARTPAVAPADLPAPDPPPAEGAGEERLYQLLYAGEIGDDVHPLGQRVRVRAWLDVMELTPPQVEGLRDVVRSVRQLEADERASRAELGRKEAEAFGPIYRELDARLAEPGKVPDDVFARFAERLSAARVAVRGDTSPAAERRARVSRLLDASARWIGTLPPPQQDRLAECRFFLARRVSPLTNPGDYDSLVGLQWDGGDYSALDATAKGGDESQMDIGGLWAMEGLRTPPDTYLVARRIQAVVVMAAQEPALAEVLGIADEPLPSPTPPPARAPPPGP